MVWLAWRNLVRDRLRFALSLAGVALAVMLILILNGYLAGVYRQAAAYLDETPGTLVVLPEDTRNTIGTAGVLPDAALHAAEGIPGVEKVLPVLSRVAILELHERKSAAFALGYDPARGGGPWSISSGRTIAAGDEIVLDRVLATEHELAVGDDLEMLGRTFSIVGLSEETGLWAGSFVFVERETLRSLGEASGAMSYMLVSLAPGTDVGVVAARLSGMPGMDAFDKSDVIASDRRLVARAYEAPLYLMVGIAFVVGVLTVGLISYTATMERRREYGILKAVGAQPRRLYTLVAAQALVTALLGGLAGVVLGYGASALLMTIRPQFLVVIEPAAAVVAFGSSVAMALIAALIPGRAVARLAPAEVFRS